MMRADFPAAVLLRRLRQQYPYITDGSIRVGYWDRPCGGQEPGSRGTRLGRPLERSSPAEIVWEITRGDAVEAAHPALQPAVVGVHVLDVEGPVADADAG